jgi:hypothetical protein
MTDRPHRPTDPDVGDLEYDLAHDVLDDSPGAETMTHKPARSIEVATRTNGYEGGDYGYDMAHDNAG